MKYILFQIVGMRDQIYGEVLSKENTYFTVRIKKTHTNLMLMLPYTKIDGEYIEIDIYHHEIIKEVSDEEYLTATILES